MTIESFLEGYARAFEWLGGVPREYVYDNLRSVVARRERDEVTWNRRFLHGGALPQEGFWPARRFAELRELDEYYADWRDPVCNRRTHGSGRFPVEERLAEERQALRRCRRCASTGLGHRSTRVPVDGYLRHGRCF